MRPRINTNIVCSSNKYEESHRAHFNALKRNHDENQDKFRTIHPEIKAKPTEVKVFGKWIKINPNAPAGVYDGFEKR